MPLSMSHSKVKFLADENVDDRLIKHIRKLGFDIISKPKGLSNGKLAEFTLLEKRILVTNDSDFSDSLKFSQDKIFSVLWLVLPQDNINLSKDRISYLLENTNKIDEFNSKLITLTLNDIGVNEIYVDERELK